jgi:hypothetical protein
VLAAVHSCEAGVSAYTRALTMCVYYHTATQVLRKVRTLKKLSTLKLQQLCEALKEEVSVAVTLFERYISENVTTVALQFPL